MNFRRGVWVHLVYIDDSADSGFQIIGAVVLPELEFMPIEEYLAGVIDRFVPEELRDAFEFHASAMFHAKEPFSKLGRDDALAILQRCVSIVEACGSIVYGAVSMDKLRGGIYATVQPVDMAFRLCMEGLANWFQDKGEFMDSGGDGPKEIGIFICDDTSNQGVKGNMKKAFRSYRRQLKSSTHKRGLLEYVHDDMYFGSSSSSVGIQLADICSFIILRHLEGKEDTEYLYKRLEPRIFFGAQEPGEIRHGSKESLQPMLRAALSEVGDLPEVPVELAKIIPKKSVTE